MRVMVLSMVSAKHRRKRISTILENEGIKFIFFDATDKKNIEVSSKTSKKTKQRKNYLLADAEIACAYSHIEMWKKVVEDNVSTIILEDNFKIEEKDIGSLEKNLRNIYIGFCENNLNYLKISHTRKVQVSQVDFQVCERFNIGYSKKATGGTSGYIISPKAAKKLIERYSEIIEPVDDFIEKPWRSGVLVYSLNPAIIYRDRESKSQIGNNRKQQFRRSIKSIIIKESFRIYEQLMHKAYTLKAIRKIAKFT